MLNLSLDLSDHKAAVDKSIEPMSHYDILLKVSH